ncbi:MAG: hypothetical protein G01um101418_737 [Parcubacteria group bacterium Gr01-1014_18]|nr:MAG: hypothetical protein Greene041636_727 [Parcubacteria group bacterium Greene0416_36]TSC80229.1 MAG: hypothetical protein G01um101418_737 [Parcubacteria group bacterium Gr01-1014_18]TSC98411.1 MAG: hypothetical protein Greene101420_764 [Parcubacteria group bacterium Greene1014_20]TSD06952.1 MAG: hypothetical protein Greene07142_515 [Parcubacteria group bacterium Greene0714_2]
MKTSDLFVRALEKEGVKMGSCKKILRRYET